MAKKQKPISPRTGAGGQTTGKSEEQEKKVIRFRELLSEMIVTEPTLTAKLCEAIDCGRFFITVTFQKKYKPADTSDLHHNYIRKGMEKNHCLDSIRYIRNDFIAKEMPTAALDPDTGWH